MGKGYKLELWILLFNSSFLNEFDTMYLVLLYKTTKQFHQKWYHVRLINVYGGFG